MKEFIIDNSPLEIETLYNVIDNELILKLSTESLKNVNDCRDYLDKKINNSDSPYMELILVLDLYITLVLKIMI